MMSDLAWAFSGVFIFSSELFFSSFLFQISKQIGSPFRLFYFLPFFSIYLVSFASVRTPEDCEKTVESLLNFSVSFPALPLMPMSSVLCRVPGRCGGGSPRWSAAEVDLLGRWNGHGHQHLPVARKGLARRSSTSLFE